jgi:hypothetical protein
MYYGKLVRQIAEALQTRLLGISEKVDHLTAAVTHEQIEQQNANQKEWEKTQEILARPRRTDPDEQAANETNQERRHRQNLGLQRILILGTWLAFAAAAVYAFIAHDQWVTLQNTYNEMHIQTGLFQKQTEAIVSGAVFKQFILSWPQKQTTYLSMNMSNRGKVAISNIHVDLRLSKIMSLGKTLPREEPLPDWSFYVPEIRSTTDLPNEHGIYLNIPQDSFRGRGMPKAIRIIGTLSYFNGFSTQTETICLYQFGWVDFVDKSGKVMSGRGPGTIVCDELPHALGEFREDEENIRK